ncbi:MAG TPA: hypothetical protein VFI15_07815, partial [Candidatus Limnocylindrales bacterium]|nr:hypothetical protein [Candidatus Limnocylindrales bacterium]
MVQHGIDRAAHRLPDADFGEWPPLGAEDPEKVLQHRCLMPVLDGRPGVRIQACSQVCAERHGKFRERFERWPRRLGEDLRDERVRNAGCVGEDSGAHAAVCQESLEVLGDARANSCLH